MEFDEASELVAEADARERNGRATRLVELTDLLGEEMVGFSGQAAQWLFDDVKATWLYGYFTSTVLNAYAFCMHQLAGLVRMLEDDPALPETAGSLEELAEVSEGQGIIGLDLRARLVALQDSANVYLSVGLHEYGAQLERRMIEAALFTDDHTLLADARSALGCSIALLHRRP